MANKCGECLLFNGSGSKCGGGLGGRGSSSSACPTNFKGPARLFNGKKCGGCRLFNGMGQKCGAGLGSRGSTSSACPTSYAPIPG